VGGNSRVGQGSIVNKSRSYTVDAVCLTRLKSQGQAYVSSMHLLIYSEDLSFETVHCLSNLPFGCINAKKLKKRTDRELIVQSRHRYQVTREPLGGI
jgi:hypothetical protein